MKYMKVWSVVWCGLAVIRNVIIVQLSDASREISG